MFWEPLEVQRWWWDVDRHKNSVLHKILDLQTKVEYRSNKEVMSILPSQVWVTTKLLSCGWPCKSQQLFSNKAVIFSMTFPRISNWELLEFKSLWLGAPGISSNNGRGLFISYHSIYWFISILSSCCHSIFYSFNSSIFLWKNIYRQLISAWYINGCKQNASFLYSMDGSN